jgi:hypothetical protein
LLGNRPSPEKALSPKCHSVTPMFRNILVIRETQLTSAATGIHPDLGSFAFRINCTKSSFSMADTAAGLRL